MFEKEKKIIKLSPENFWNIFFSLSADTGTNN